MKAQRPYSAHPVRRGIEKTFRNPMTYIGALTVGGLSLYTSQYSWGIATPFLVPFFVQMATRILAEREHHAAQK